MLQREVPMSERLHRDRREMRSVAADEDPTASADDARRRGIDAEGRPAGHGPAIVPRRRGHSQRQMRPSGGVAENPRAVDDCASDSGG